jgi:hypothetical protein
MSRNYQRHQSLIAFEGRVEVALREKFNRTPECAEEWVDLSLDYIETQFSLRRPAVEVAHEIFMERVTI